MNTLYQINTILSIDKRIKVYFLFFSTLIISVLDLIGLSSILPILLILSDPNYLNNKYIIILLNNFYFLNKDNFLLYSIVFLFSVFLLKIILSLLFHYIKYKILWNYYEKISNRLISNYVKIDYLGCHETLLIFCISLYVQIFVHVIRLLMQEFRERIDHQFIDDGHF